jgi:hypothetical protein
MALAGAARQRGNEHALIARFWNPSRAGHAREASAIAERLGDAVALQADARHRRVRRGRHELGYLAERRLSLDQDLDPTTATSTLPDLGCAGAANNERGGCRCTTRSPR